MSLKIDFRLITGKTHKRPKNDREPQTTPYHHHHRHHDSHDTEPHISYDDYLKYLEATKVHKPKHSRPVAVVASSTKSKKRAAHRTTTATPAFDEKERLPIGLAYFDSNLYKDMMTPITYTPHPPYSAFDQRNREHFDDSDTDDDDDEEAESRRRVQIVDKRSFHSEQNPTPMQSVQRVRFHAVPNHIETTMMPEQQQQIDSTATTDENARPEMFRFTLDDAVVRAANRTRRTQHQPTQPSAMLSTPNYDQITEYPLSANRLQHSAAMMMIAPQIKQSTNEMFPHYVHRPMRVHDRYLTPKMRYRKIEEVPLRSIDSRLMMRPHQRNDVSRIRTQVVAATTTTTAQPITDNNSNNELQIKSAVEQWTLAPHRTMNHRRRLPTSSMQQSRRVTPNHLEVSQSYTKQRVQGWSSENLSTTPMSTVEKAKEDVDLVVAPATRPRKRLTPQDSQTKYFQ